MSDVHRLLGRQLPSHKEVYAHQDIGQSERVTSLCQAVRAEATRVVEASAAECQLYYELRTSAFKTIQVC